MKPETIKAIFLVVVAAAIFGAGWAVEGWRMGEKIADIQKVHADTQRRAAEENAEKLSRAQGRGDALMLQLAGWENTLTAFAQEKEHEIRRLTVGRRCLDAAAVSLLNRPAGLKQPGLVPETAGEYVRADAGFATDTDVGTWINQCRRGYETCRGRLQAIADFYVSEESPAAQTKAGDSARLCAGCGE